MKVRSLVVSRHAEKQISSHGTVIVSSVWKAFQTNNLPMLVYVEGLWRREEERRGMEEKEKREKKKRNREKVSDGRATKREKKWRLHWDRVGPREFPHVQMASCHVLACNPQQRYFRLCGCSCVSTPPPHPRLIDSQNGCPEAIF